MIWVLVFSILTEKCQSCHSSKLTLDLTWLEPIWMLLQSCAWITRKLFIIQPSLHNLGMNLIHKINFYGVISTSKNCTYFKKTEVINLSSVLMLNKYHLTAMVNTWYNILYNIMHWNPPTHNKTSFLKDRCILWFYYHYVIKIAKERKNFALHKLY